MPTIQETPQLTVYRNGQANLNSEATRALPRGTASLLLLPPTRTACRWLLLPDTEGLSGDIRLHGRADRGNLRFRAPDFAVALFASLPDESAVVRLRMERAALGWRLVAQ